ncbi:hypothetical protein HMI54_013340 [Coelomomyces lativittatus]|nr:hypothetical protein HMI54_013340 [Coelomomyces lativittatus]
MLRQREAVVCATFNVRSFLKENKFPRTFSPAYQSLPFEYTGRRVDVNNGIVQLYGYVMIEGTKLPVVKTITMSVPENRKGCKSLESKSKPCKPKTGNPLTSGIKRVTKKICMKTSKPQRVDGNSFPMRMKGAEHIQFMTKKQIERRHKELCESVKKIFKKKLNRTRVTRHVKGRRSGKKELGLPIFLARRHLNEHYQVFFF